MAREEINIDLDPALIREQYGGVSEALIPQAIPIAGAVTSIKGMAGPAIDVVGSTSSGLTVTITAGSNTLTVGLSGVGDMATKAKTAAVTKLVMTVSNPPTQAEVQSIANKLDELIDALKNAGHSN